jgi:hypothetical protein
MSEQGTPTAIIHLGDTKHIEPGKTYSIEVEQLVPLDDEAVKNIIQTFEQATGAKVVVIHKAKVNNSGVVTMPVEELRKLTQAVARVREIHRPLDGDALGILDPEEICKECSNDYPCPTIKALDGDSEPSNTEPIITVTSYPMLEMTTRRLRIPTASPCADGDFCKVVNGRIKHDRFCDNINHRDKD